MTNNINTKDYWDDRFSSRDWEDKSGRLQTENFAKGQLKYFNIPENFTGTILDFGCGLGDAMPIYKQRFPKAKLIGLDISQSAIEKCNMKYGHIASFMQGDYSNVPQVDIIISSNVFEHLSHDREIAQALISKCKRLYIIVPYREMPLCLEHVNSYDEHYFSSIGKKYEYQIFSCKGWTQEGIKGLGYGVYFKNIFRFLMRKKLHRRQMQIMFSFEGEGSS